MLTSKNTFVACSAASSGVISNKGISIGLLEAGPSVNCKKRKKKKKKKKKKISLGEKWCHLRYLP